MADVGLLGYAAAFVGSAAISLLLVPRLLRFAVARDLVDRPGGPDGAHGHKAHDRATPYLGGVAIVGAFSVVVAIAGAIARPVGGYDELVAILAGGLGLAGIGVLDDVRGVGVTARVAATLAAGTGIYAAGVRVDLVSFEPLDVVLTLGFLLVVTHALNLLDNMDGLSAGTALLVALGFLLIAAVNGQFLVASLAAALAGAAAGFLRHNAPPARIYLGDGGSLFLGFLLAVLAIKLRFEAPRAVTAFVPVVLLAVPLLDTTLVVVDRTRHGRSPFVGGRDHVSHRLVHLGLPRWAAVALIHLGTIGAVLAALAVSRIQDPVAGWLVLSLILLAGVSAFVALLLVPVYDRPAGPPIQRDALALRSSSRSSVERVP